MAIRAVSGSLRALSVLSTCAFATSLALADGSETLGDPAGLDLLPGTGYAAAGIGLSLGQPAGISLSIPPHAEVVQAILYWEGNSPTPMDVPDSDTIKVNGTDVTGRFIGGAIGADTGATQFLTYRADITATGAVQPGDNTISVSGMDFGQNNGAGILAVIDEGGTGATLLLKDGSDRAFVGSSAPMDTTVPQLFSFDAAGVARSATLVLLFSDVSGRVSGESDLRPNRIAVWLGNDLGSAPTLVLDNALASNDGEEWDTLVVPVEIPAGETLLQVQALSEGDGGTPASFTWIAAGLSVPLPAAGGEGCSAGYWSVDASGPTWPEPYTPATPFADVFDGSFGDLSLGDVVSQAGNGLVGLGRQAVAALLNAASGGVDYDLSAGEVIDTYLQAVAGDANDIDSAAAYLAAFSAQGCGLGDDPGDLPVPVDEGAGDPGESDGSGENGDPVPGDPIDPGEPTDPGDGGETSGGGGSDDDPDPAAGGETGGGTDPGASDSSAETAGGGDPDTTGGSGEGSGGDTSSDAEGGSDDETTGDASSGDTSTLPPTVVTPTGAFPVRSRAGGGSTGLVFLTLLAGVAGVRRAAARAAAS